MMSRVTNGVADEALQGATLRPPMSRVMSDEEETEVE
jgi:hypothetical protein